MQKNIILIISISLLIISGCTDDSPLVPEVNLVVIQGYLYANEPITDIQITSTLPLSSQDTLAPPINDADVCLIKNGQRYNLLPGEYANGYYHYNGDDLFVKEGDSFEIEVDYFGKIAYGETKVPTAPQSATISNTTLYIPDISYGFQIDSTKNMLKVNWTYEPSSLFYVAIENLESNPTEIEISGPRGGFGQKGPGRFISAPRNSNEYTISFLNVTHYGKHSIKVYRVNQEYADLYISRQQDSRDLNEPLTNIKNGLGVFSAFNSDSLVFNVVKNDVSN